MMTGSSRETMSLYDWKTKTEIRADRHACLASTRVILLKLIILHVISPAHNQRAAAREDLHKRNDLSYFTARISPSKVERSFRVSENSGKPLSKIGELHPVAFALKNKATKIA